MPATPRGNSKPAEAETKKKLHVYKSPDASFLSEYIFFPFYDKIVTYYPRQWVPNWITGFGILCTVTASVLMFYCLPKGSSFPKPFALLPQPTPSNAATPTAATTFVIPDGSALGEYISISTLLIVAGVLNAVYCIADNTDGRQARRTKQTSFIGEYLDHGLDCVTALMSTFLVTLCLGQTFTAAMLTTATIATVTLVAHVLHFTDKIFIWGNRVVSVDEAMVGFAAAPIIHVMAGGPSGSAYALDDFLPAVVAEYVPRGYAVLDAILMLFLFVQLTVIVGLFAKNANNLKDFSFLLLLVVNAVMFYLASEHTNAGVVGGAGLSACVKGLFSYPAIWAISYAFAASIVSHIPIVAQCARVEHQDNWPFVLVFFALFVFAVDPLWGMIGLVLGHSYQLIVNTRWIQHLGMFRQAAQGKKY